MNWLPGDCSYFLGLWFAEAGKGGSWLFMENVQLWWHNSEKGLGACDGISYLAYVVEKKLQHSF